MGASTPLQELPPRRLHWQRARGATRDTHRAVVASPGPERQAREATQMQPQSEREFESRSGKGPRLRAVPAHCQPLGGRGAASCERGPPGPQPARAFPAPGRKSGPSREGAAAGGTEGGPGIFPVGGDSGPRLESRDWRLGGGKLRGAASWNMG